jgi:Family of unknown function (DUF7009)
MKLRLYENSLRFRLTPAEVAELAEGGQVISQASFGVKGKLRYGLRCDPSAAGITASFESENITVVVPAAMARRWAGSDEVRLFAEQSTDAGASLRILIEKDFECVDASKSEPGLELYPNPRNLAGKMDIG